MEKEILPTLPANEKTWKSSFNLRLLTSIAIILGLTVALFLRELSVFVFDVILLGLLGVTVFEVIRAKNSHQKSLFERQKAEKKRPASVPLTEGRMLNGVYIYIYMAFAYAIFLVGILIDTPFSFGVHIAVQTVMVFVFAVYIFLLHYMDSDRVKYCRLRNLKLSRESWLYTLEYLKVLLYPALLMFAFFPLNHLGDMSPVLQNACTATCAEEHVHIVNAASINIGLVAIIMVFAISCFTDTFAYITGSWLKGPKLVPNISPKKTVSGAIGGLFGGVLAVLVVMLCFSGDQFFLDFFTDKIGDVWAVRFACIGFGLIGSVLTQAGDIYASWFKRRTEIKDFGSYLPGHGGAMDRLDGISFNAVFVLICMLVLVFLI